MINIPINHKTLFIFDHSIEFLNACGELFEFDVINKVKPAASSAQPHTLEPLKKSIWTCITESSIEFCRHVFDIFPEDKLISMLISKPEFNRVANIWNSDYGLDYYMNLLGNMPIPIAYKNETDEALNLYKTLSLAVNVIVQTTKQQQSLMTKYPNDVMLNSGRIILFTPSKYRNIQEIQQFMVQAINEWNKNVEQSSNSMHLKISRLELVIIDVAMQDQVNLQFPNEILNKEELNANTSANYDVELLHEKSVHDQLRITGLFKNCILKKDSVDVVCLKWSNPKTSINDFNFTNASFRVSPCDVSSRPTACLTTFLLSGRCVILEARSSLTGTANRISSHMLCTHGNEIYIHCLNTVGKLRIQDRPSFIETNEEKLADYRMSEFSELLKTHSNFQPFTLNYKINRESNVKSVLSQIECATRVWPVSYSESILANISIFKTLMTCIAEKVLDTPQYNECVKTIELFQNLENKNETYLPTLSPVGQKLIKNYKRKEQYKLLWTELESFLKQYEEQSDRHRSLYDYVSKLKKANVMSTLINEQSNYEMSLQIQNQNSNLLIGTTSRKPEGVEANSLINDAELNYENEKLARKRKLNFNPFGGGSTTLAEFWSNNLNLNTVINQREFHARLLNAPNTIAPLYTHLKIDETNARPFSSKNQA